MRQAIAYIRVSTDHQGESGFGSDAQRAHVRAFAKESGFRIRKFYSDVDTGMGDDNVNVRPGRALAAKHSQRTSWPIIVASLDRFARNTKMIEDWVLKGRLNVISARLGEHATNAVVRSQAFRDQREGELIGKRTKAALAVLKLNGVQLGNKDIRTVAQPKAVETNIKNAKQRMGEFERMLAVVQRNGAKKAKQIADALNERGFVTARGERWTPGNVARARGKLRAQHRSEAQDDAIQAAMAVMFGDDGTLTSEGAERWRKAMIAKKANPVDIDRRIAAVEHKSFGEEQRRTLAKWVVAAEATIK